MNDCTLLSDEQKRGIDEFVAWYRYGKIHGFSQRPRFTLVGPAGSGKSTLAAFALQAAGLSLTSPTVVKAAPTGKAAYVMRQKGLVGSSSIHKLIYHPVEAARKAIAEMRKQLTGLRGKLAKATDAERDLITAQVASLTSTITELSKRSDDDMGWILNPMSPLAEASLAVIDEAGMVDGHIQADLESFGVPILYLGDHGQLPPIADDVDSVFFFKNGKPKPADFELLQIHRQAEGSPIVRFSRDIRLNLPGQHFMGVMRGEDGGTLIRINRNRITSGMMARAAQVVVGYNKSRLHVNDVVRQELGRQSAYPEPGDKLVCLKNNSDYAVVNGLMATAKSEFRDVDRRNHNFRIDLETDDGVLIEEAPVLTTYFQYPGDTEAMREVPGWAKRKGLHFDYGYAITCHKSQGSAFPMGIVIDEAFGSDEALKRRWRYTAVTRFSESVIIGA